ncbi:hypothetical protein K2Y11_15510, partial [bacterium]|nr:hypothetical protein [bacterium]
MRSLAAHYFSTGPSNMRNREPLRCVVLLLVVVSTPTLWGEGRSPANDDELGYWLRNMLLDHDYTIDET